jgi:hypothetical protein
VPPLLKPKITVFGEEPGGIDSFGMFIESLSLICQLKKGAMNKGNGDSGREETVVESLMKSNKFNQ